MMKKIDIRRFLVKRFPLLILSLPVVHAAAQKPSERYAFEIIPVHSTTFTSVSDGMINDRTGFPSVLYHLNDFAAGNSAADKARSWLMDHAAKLGLLHTDLSDLSLKNTRASGAGFNVRFTQQVQGIPVHGAEIVVNIDLYGSVRYVTNDYVPDVPAELPAPAITAAEARATAISYTGLSGTFQVDRSRLVVWPLDGECRLAWELRMIADAPMGDWEILADAVTGELLKVEDKTCFHHRQDQPDGDEICGDEKPGEWFAPLLLPPPPPVTGSGYAFDADPLSSAAVAYAGAYVDGSDATNASLDAQRFTRSLNDITFTSPNYSLVGPYATIVDHESPFRGLFTQTSSTFNFNRFDNAFEAVNTYYQIDKSMRHLNLTLAVPVMPYQYAGGVQYDPHGLSGADNSHYTSGSGRLAFGEGGVDDAEDSDVILHELGHGLHDWVTTGGLSNTEGLSEGTGDYWTQSYSRSLGQWTTAAAAYHWVFNWDGHNPFWGGRTTNYGAVYPGGLTGAIHTDGQIWSTCLMKIWDAIGRNKTDVVLWEGLAMTGGTTNQQNAAIAVRQAAINLGYSSSDISTISTLLTSCGYTLPVILAVNLDRFDGKRVSAAEVSLEWLSATEVNHDRFVVERRLAHEDDFTDVGQVFAAGNTFSAHHYRFSDPNGHQGTSYYRLRFIDVNGNTDWSHTVEVQGASSGNFAVALWPNPSHDEITLEIFQPTGTTHPVHVTVTDLVGRTLSDETYETASDAQHPAFAKTLPSGIYLVAVSTGQHREVVRWVKE